MTIYDLYGSESTDLEIARKQLEASLSIVFLMRESDYQGGNYFISGQTNGMHYILKKNIDLHDKSPSESVFSNYHLLFYANEISNSVEIREKILTSNIGFTLLRHEDIP